MLHKFLLTNMQNNVELNFYINIILILNASLFLKQNINSIN